MSLYYLKYYYTINYLLAMINVEVIMMHETIDTLIKVFQSKNVSFQKYNNLACQFHFPLLNAYSYVLL